jgi:hypothetical protein
MNRRGRKKAPLQENYSIADSKAMVTRILDTLIHTLLILIPLEAADMYSVHCKYGIAFFSTLHSHGNFSFQMTKVLSVTECFRFVELL